MTVINHFAINNAKDLLMKPPDGSNANAQSRDRAADYLIMVADAFINRAHTNPTSPAGQYLQAESLECRIIASRA